MGVTEDRCRPIGVGGVENGVGMRERRKRTWLLDLATLWVVRWYIGGLGHVTSNGFAGVYPP